LLRDKTELSGISIRSGDSLSDICNSCAKRLKFIHILMASSDVAELRTGVDRGRYKNCIAVAVSVVQTLSGTFITERNPISFRLTKNFFPFYLVFRFVAMRKSAANWQMKKKIRHFHVRILHVRVVGTFFLFSQTFLNHLMHKKFRHFSLVVLCVLL